MKSPVVERTRITLNIPTVQPPLALYVHGDQDKFVSRQIRETGLWEPYETALVLDFLEEGSVFVDVGANIGYFSIVAAALVGDSGLVIAFEPDPANIQLLRASSALNGVTSRLEAVEAGLSTSAENARLFLSEDNLGDHQIYAGKQTRTSLPIKLYNGSDYLRPRLKRMDLLKVDTQGSEYQVMLGLLPLLQELSDVPRIIIELTPFSLREAGASGRQLIELLAILGKPFWIIDHLQHNLVASTEAELAQWCDNVDLCPDDQGFMNILIGATHPPEKTVPGFLVPGFSI